MLIVQINPRERRKVPKRTREIVSRVNEINFNASLLSELRAVAFVTRLIDEGRLPRGVGPGEFRHLKLHRIVMEDAAGTSGARNALASDYEHFKSLRKLGQRAARRFLRIHISMISAGAARSMSRRRLRRNWWNSLTFATKSARKGHCEDWG